MKKILFVCSGNTCRSPMAEAVFNRLAEEKGFDGKASSCGLYTSDGLPYSENSIQALKEDGIEISGSSKAINENILKESDFVFGLTYSLSTSLVSEFPEYADKIYRFPIDVPDPFGGDIVLYKRSLAKIKDGVEKILEVLKTRQS